MLPRAFIEWDRISPQFAQPRRKSLTARGYPQDAIILTSEETGSLGILGHCCVRLYMAPSPEVRLVAHSGVGSRGKMRGREP